SIDFSIAQIVKRKHYVVISDCIEGSRVSGDCLEHLFEFYHLETMIHIHDTDLEMLHFAAKCVAQHDELHERQNHRDENKRQTSPETPQVAFDDDQDAVHGLFAIIHNADVVTRASLQRVAQLVTDEINEYIIQRGA